MSQDISNTIKYNKLSPADIEFYERVNDAVTGSYALPFSIPVDNFFKIVVRGLKFFWEWHESATQEQLLYVPKSAILEAKQTDSNYDLVLPNGIEGVLDWKTGEANIGGGHMINDLLRVSLLQTYSMTPQAGYGYRSGYGQQPLNTSNLTVSMFEASNFRESFTRGVTASYNKLTQIFRIMSEPPAGLALTCAVRVQPELLYHDLLFEEYITSMVEMQLGRIVMSFDFKLPGDIQINYDEIKSSGADRKREIEEQIKDASNNMMIQMK